MKIQSKLLVAGILLYGMIFTSSCVKDFDDGSALVNILILMNLLNSGVTAAPASSSDTIPPIVPGAFTSPTQGPSQIDFTWTAATDDITGSGAMRYEICMNLNTPYCDAFQTIYTTSPGALAYSATGLTPLTTYYFKIRAVDEAGNQGPASAELSVTTTAAGILNPPSFSPVAGNYDGTQSVTISADAGAKICYRTDGTAAGCTSAVCNAGSTEFTGAVTVGISQTVNAISCQTGYPNSASAAAAYTIDTAVPSIVTGTSVSAVSSTQLDISWASALDDTTPVSNLYEICQSVTAGGCNTFTASYSTSPTANVLAYSVTTGLSAFTTYYFRVRAIDQYSKVGVPSAEFSGTTLSAGTAASPTYGIAAGTYGTAQSVAISTASPGAGICYTIDGVTDPVCDSASGCTTGTSIASGGTVSVSASQTIRSRACLAGYLPSAVVPSAYVIDAAAPADVSNLSGASGNGQVTLSWTNPWDTDLSHVVITPPLGAPITLTAGSSTAGAVQNYVVTGLTNGVLGLFRVQAVDAVGNTSAGSTVYFHASPNVPGANTAFTAGGITYNMKYVPPKTTFIGNADIATANVMNGFWAGETEVTYELWDTVYQWAILNGYSFSNPGQQGSSNTTCGSPVVQANQPVTCMGYGDALVWANAYTAWYNAQTGSAFTFSYYTDGTFATPIVNAAAAGTPSLQPGATGFRLLIDRNEFELAARYIADSNNDGDIIDPGEYTPGNYPSGGLGPVDTTSAVNSYPFLNPVAWYGATTAYPDGNTITSQPVKTKLPNQLGLYDLTGNVRDLFFGMGCNGGSFLDSSSVDLLTVGRWQSCLTDPQGYLGVRIAKNE
ncbi:MAG: SUMF1/EgtB/PvdO family nonheme iron enzyme [Spirochaetia bacterium]|nr:SUMF1/EgtB/PvdO family nonheme iron enzyme [Spirochaetia bacterium]